MQSSLRSRAATVVIFANAFGLIFFLQTRTDRLLSAVVDPLHPDWAGMERAFAGFTLYAVSLLGVVLIALLFVGRVAVARLRARKAETLGEKWRVFPTAVLAGGLTAIVVLVLIEVLIFQDYGVHLYEFDVFGILADAALRRDLGIQPAEVLRVTIAAATLLAAEFLLCIVALRLAGWRNGALARACTAAMAIAVPGGLTVFRVSEDSITSDRVEFEGALPFGKQLLLRNTSRPYIAVAPRLGANGYPVLASTDAAPVIPNKKNVLFFVTDGLRGDMVKPELTPNLLRFAARDDVIHSRRHISTGHVSEAGIFGLVYALDGQEFFSFIESRVPAYPLEVLKRNGYETFLLASSRLNPYPTDQLLKVFDKVTYPKNDDEALRVLAEYVDARRADGKPYFVLAFFYTPHYPFTSAKPPFRRYPLVGPSARTNYMNDVLQADDYFRQTLELVRHDFDAGKTIVLATSDHGEEIRDHGVFGHASATFWNEKIVVPFMLGLPHAEMTAGSRQPPLSSHVDVWPTVFDYLGLIPRRDPSTYSDGRSLLDPAPRTAAYVAGRFFPYADRPSVLVDRDRKYWFRVNAVTNDDHLCVELSRLTDLEDRRIDPAVAFDLAAQPAFTELQSSFWRFIEPVAGKSPRPEKCSAHAKVRMRIGP